MGLKVAMDWLNIGNSRVNEDNHDIRDMQK